MSETVILERELKHPPHKVWRALTESPLIGEWLMSNDFKPVVDHTFTLSAAWGSVACRVLKVEDGKRLSYTWNAMGLESTVTFTLTTQGAGTRLRMEQEGFASDSDNNYRGAVMGWGRFLDGLEQVVARLD